LRAWRGPVATLPAFCCLNTVLAGNGWSCTKADVRRPLQIY